MLGEGSHLEYRDARQRSWLGLDLFPISNCKHEATQPYSMLAVGFLIFLFLKLN